MRLYQQFDSNQREGLYFITGKQKRVLFALKQYFPITEKMFCCKHIYADFKAKYLDELLKKKFWAAYMVGNTKEFNAIMEEIKLIT